MEITTTYPKQTTLAKQTSLANKQKSATPENGKESGKSDQVAVDSVQFSKEAVKLSQTSTPQQAAAPTPVENTGQAQKTAALLVAGFESNPGLALQTHAKLSQVNLKQLLE